MSNFLQEALSFVANAAPSLETTLINDAENALAAAEAPLAPVAEAGADQIVTLVLSKVGGEVATPLAISFVNAVIAGLTAKLPAVK